MVGDYFVEDAQKDLEWLDQNVFEIEPPEPDFHAADYIGLLDQIREFTERVKGSIRRHEMLKKIEKARTDRKKSN